jgi:hypothetical protein
MILIVFDLEIGQLSKQTEHDRGLAQALPGRAWTKFSRPPLRKGKPVLRLGRKATDQVTPERQATEERCYGTFSVGVSTGGEQSYADQNRIRATHITMQFRYSPCASSLCIRHSCLVL